MTRHEWDRHFPRHAVWNIQFFLTHPRISPLIIYSTETVQPWKSSHVHSLRIRTIKKGRTPSLDPLLGDVINISKSMGYLGALTQFAYLRPEPEHAWSESGFHVSTLGSLANNHLSSWTQKKYVWMQNNQQVLSSLQLVFNWWEENYRRHLPHAKTTN